MKELEIHYAPQEWQLAGVAREMMDKFYFFQATLTEDRAMPMPMPMPMPMNTMKDPLDLDEKVLLKEKCEVLGFQSLVV